ncbi:carboxylesterase/lipase family protein [Amycolatopsis echigonensis]|uniref:Carboxylic ester hydrolase n=1 Tax=Amycolatopsis echigonensis TaxID=2576905 RepID=A0A2N3WMW3_9PSEU|nr:MULTISPECIES: carboxylesterase family protein [Amycolatopsis]MBB2504871.1 carboxylesterase family protein [Amycolatopsis echigonensis]PKV95209.1 para-nitrobenzyl esterase [Amycolatopsis niigatensis]
MRQKENPVVQTAAGAVRGRADEAGELYWAIPYAAAPAGPGRFAPPAPHPGWSGARDGTQPSPTAPQPVRDFGRLDLTPYFGPGWVPGDEYLTVDVRTPAADSGKRPVMVFVHGGGFVTGSTRAALYDGRAFARDGVVLVTVNYRLGIPGFLALEGAPDNRGLLDVLAALRWVRDSIAAFGGDPANVTVFGQSAGGTLTGALLATSEAKGLFRRAIVQSGSGTGAFTPEQARRVTSAAAAALGVAPTATAFAEIPDARLLEILPALAGLDLDTSTAPDPLAGLSPFSLVLPAQPADRLVCDVDLLLGTNTEEGRLYLVPQGKPDDTADELGERLFGAGTARLAQAHAEIAGGGTYRYSFGCRSTALDGRLGAAHTVELPFVFDLADEPWLHGDTGLLGPDPAPAGLAAEVHAAWVAFARTGNPGWAAGKPHSFVG